MRDNERLEADLVALREAAQAVVDSFEISDWNAQATAMDALRAVLASA